MSIFGSGHEVVTSTTRPASPTIGQIIFETDTLSYRWYNGTSWEGVTPIATIQPFAGTTAPSGWKFCDGGAGTGAGTGTLNGSAGQPFSDLWLAIGNTYNVAGVRAAFYLPDMRGRAPVGKGANAAVSTLNNSDLLADASRNPNHSHTIAHTHPMPHTHNMGSHTHGEGSQYARIVFGGNIYYANVGGGGSWGTTVYGGVQTISGNAGTLSGGLTVGGSTGGPSTNTTDGVNTANTSGSDTANSGSAVQPFLVTNYIIKI